MTVTAVAAMMSPATASPPPKRLAVPPPTGHHAVGTAELHLVDETRADPWVPESGPRELVVSMYYPAAVPVGAPRQYLTAREAEILLAANDLPEIPPELLAGTRSSARVGAPPLPRWHGYPLAVLSNGLGMPRATLTGLAEDLASRGYVVAAVGHNYEADGTAFPDGHVTECAACGPGLDHVLLSKVRTADVSFVLNRLTARDSPYALLIDPAKIGLVGQSVGGNAAPLAMLADRRIRAGVNLDGRFWSPLPESGVDRPILLLGRESAHTPTGPDPTWPESWPKLHGWKRWLSVDGAAHTGFTDNIALMDQAGVTKPGTMPGARSMELTRAYVAAFLDLHLRGRPQPLLDGPVATNPEVRFWP
ncbi:alpha/beta hydrolase [Amycolatopsis minnesotensis]|uniref:Alpha/beta hydrolase n=2 Tax=Amycolatopsis minnesotensis TaxID=337894 RepID=A0ABN2RC57_9PSEU